MFRTSARKISQAVINRPMLVETTTPRLKIGLSLLVDYFSMAITVAAQLQIFTAFHNVGNGMYKEKPVEKQG